MRKVIVMPKIIIDAGHYSSYNQSPVYKQYYEGNQMWKLSQYLKKALEEYGFTVGSTKDYIDGYPKTKLQDGSIIDDVEKRGRMAKGYDMMISLHSNACNTESVDRAVIIQPMSGDVAIFAKMIGECVKSAMGVSSYQLAQRDYNTGAYYYDSKKHSGMDYYGVIRGAALVGTPCIIIEHGFHTNTAVAKWLMSDANLKKLAEAEAKTIAEYYGAAKKAAASGTIYRVQVGAYSQKANAEAMLAKLKKAGFEGYITTK